MEPLFNAVGLLISMTSILLITCTRWQHWHISNNCLFQQLATLKTVLFLCIVQSNVSPNFETSFVAINLDLALMNVSYRLQYT